jgi:hypothetical protein
MWINIVIGVLSFGAGMLCLDFMNASKEENDLKKIKDDKDFDLKVRTIAYREVNERMDSHKELLKELASTLGYDSHFDKVYSPWDVPKPMFTKKSKKKKVSQ